MQSVAKLLRQDQKGYYYRNLGYEERHGKRTQPKFILGKDRVPAEERLRRIEWMWEQIVKEHSLDGTQPVWSDVAKDIARAVARGDVCYEVPYEEDGNTLGYAAIIRAMAAMWPVIAFVPADPISYVLGIKSAELEGVSLLAKAEEIQAEAERVHKEASGFLVTAGTSAKPLKPIGGSVHKAMKSYIAWIQQEYFDSSEGHVSDTGNTKIRQLRTLMHHLPNVPLAKLDYEQCDRLFGIIRRRPESRRHGTPMTEKSCSNYIGELRRFLEWLDTSSDYNWELPLKFSRIKLTPIELASDIEKAAADVPVYEQEQLTTLYLYATPIERFFLLLALNCAFGADQAGRVRISEIDFNDDGSPIYLGHLRRKRKVRGSHCLWGHTAEMLKWMLSRHKSPAPSDRIAIHRNGTSYYRKSKGGNRQNDIAKAWNRLLDRIECDDRSFPRYGFNTLRDTSTNMVRQLGGDELASLHCTHKHQSADKNLGAYSNPRREALYRIHNDMEQLFSGMFDAVPEPRKPNPQAYTSLGTITKIKSLHEDGLPVAQIAKAANVSVNTVYRHLNGQT